MLIRSECTSGHGQGVLKWEMAGTKHFLAVSETSQANLSYFQEYRHAARARLRAIAAAEVDRLMFHGELEASRPDRRKAPRYRYEALVEIEWGSARLRARTRDISASGMFLESEDVLWVGAGFRARLTVDRPVYMECSVKRVEPGRGMGVTVEVQDEQSRHFHDLLARLAEGA